MKSPEPAEDKGMWMSARRFSVSRLAIGLSDFAVLFWTAVLVLDVIRLVRRSSPISGATRIGLLSFVAVTIAFGVALVWWGRSTNASNR